MKFSKRERVLVTLLGCSVLIVSVVLFFGFGNYPNQESEELKLQFLDEMGEEPQIFEEPEKVEKSPLIMIDVKGAVHKPGVYELQAGSRIFDAVNNAGGFLEEADQAQMNLAVVLTDEMLVYVPRIGEEITNIPVSASQQETDGKIAINHAAASDLETLPGIGPAKASAIISYREENGQFENLEDLLNVSGIGEKSAEQLREHLSFK